MKSVSCRHLPALSLLLVFSLASSAALSAQQQSTQELYAKAQRSVAAGRMDDAREDYQQLARLNPAIAEIHASLGAIDFQQKRFSEALEESTEAHRLKPSLAGLDSLIAMSLSELGRFNEALPGLESTYKDTQDPQIKRLSGLELERAYTAVHREADAVEVALALQKLFPKDAEVLYHNERIFGSFAYLTVQQLVEAAPDSVWRHQAQAEAQEAAGAHDSAIAEYRAILAIDPNRAEIHYKIGRALRARAHDAHDPKDLAAAMAEFQEELKIDPGNASALYEIGELHRVAGELEPARTSFAAALKIYPDFPEANLGLGTVLAELQKPAEALPYLNRAVQSDAEDEAAWYRLWLVQRSLGQTAEAKESLARFQKLHQRGLPEQQVSPRDVTRQVIESPAMP